MKIVLIIPVLLICTGVTASEYRSDFPVFLQDTIIHTDSLTFTGKEEVLKSKARKRDNGKPHSPHRATIMAMDTKPQRMANGLRRAQKEPV